jgi:Ca-activated chloride channel family protein
MAALVTATAGAQPRAQQTHDPQQQQLLKLNVLVTNGSGDPISDLKQEDFIVLENDVPQTISFFSNEELPLIYAILVDTSASFKDVLESALGAAKIVVEQNKPGDETMLVRFVDSNKIETVKDLTSDRTELIESLQNFKYFYIEGGQSAVVDAVYLTAQSISKYKKTDGVSRRRAILLITDGEDRSSYYKKEQLIELLRKEDVQVFVLAVVGGLEGWRKGSPWGTPREKATNLVNSLAKESGGLAVFPKSATELATTAKRFPLYPRSQYSIGYLPSNQASAKLYRKVTVKIVERPERKNLVVTTRSGYVTLQR